jgi:alkanesulfonate monooxygenase SsuD/methylene tetrahydromethanopterin reductase-like flavin-dependent oxidoreductase (luciferase family)
VRFPELGIYQLPGHTDTPADILREAREAEALGLGSAWISERFDVKEVGWLDESIPLLMTAFGPRSLEFAGGVFDGVILHTFMSDEAVARAAALVRRGAEKAGRDPASVQLWAVLAVACDASEDRQLKLLTARMATYLQAPGYGELLFAINGWDPKRLAGFRSSDAVRSIPGGIDSLATVDQLRAIRDLTPAEWLPAAAGSPAQCARRIADQFAAGADGVILHASLPHELAPAVEAWAATRPADCFQGRSGRPA